jgi:hypothetical protein
MKQLLFILFIIGYLPLISFSQNTEELIAKHFQAIGGEQKWNQINSLIIEKTTNDENVLITSKEYFVRNKFYRNDLIISGRTVSDSNKKYFLLVNKTLGWKSLPDNKSGKIESMSMKEVSMYLQHINLDDPFVNYKSSGTSILFMNREYFNEKDYYKMLIKTKDGMQEYCYLDPTTYLISLRVTLGGENESSIEYTSYKKNAEGMMLPSEIITSAGITTFQKLIFNPNIKEDLFQLSTVK